MEALCESLVTTAFLAASKPSDYPFAATVVAILVTFTTSSSTHTELTVSNPESDQDQGQDQDQDKGQQIEKNLNKVQSPAALMTLYRSLQPALTLAGRDTRISDGSKVWSYTLLIYYTHTMLCSPTNMFTY